MNQINIALGITTILIGLIVPFVSVKYSLKVSKEYNEQQYMEDQRIQRKKLLILLQKEAEMYKEYYLQNQVHRAKEFVTAKLILTTPAFNAVEHGTLIELALEMERINQNLDTAMNALTGLYSSTLAAYISNLSKGSLLLTLSNSKLTKLLTGKTHIEKVAEGLQNMLDEGIYNNTKEVLPLIEKIIKETERLKTLETTTRESEIF